MAGVTFGVMAAAHREPGKVFSPRDELVLATIADFTAIAIQNSRLYKATENALDKAHKELTELNSALAHDLRGPVASIRGYAELLKMQVKLDETQSKFVANILSASKRMLNLIDQLLDVALLTGTAKLEFNPFDLVSTVEKVLNDLDGAALMKEIALDKVVSGTPYKIDGDAIRLYRCILNLVDNAVKYCPEKAQVTVSLEFGEEIVIRVRDTGRGLPEEELPFIFDKYYQGKGGGHTKKAGIGIGLPMVRSTVQAHGGTITAHNVEGGGAEFVIRLPGSLRTKAD